MTLQSEQACCALCQINSPIEAGWDSREPVGWMVQKKTGRVQPGRRHNLTKLHSYCFFFVVFLALVAALAFADGSSKVKESAALNGYCFTDSSPVVLSVTSTRRLLARRMVRMFLRIFWRCSGVTCGLVSTRSLT